MMDYVELHKRRQMTSGDRVVLDGGLIGIVGTITYDHGDAASVEWDTKEGVRAEKIDGRVGYELKHKLLRATARHEYKNALRMQALGYPVPLPDCSV